MKGAKWICNILVAGAILVSNHTSAMPPEHVKYDVVIRNGTVVDGTGRPGYVADVAIRGDHIVFIGKVPEKGTVTVDAGGLVVAPGFIDMHNHSEYSLLVDGHGPSFSLQGVTLQVFGEDDSMGPVGGKRIPPDLPPGVKLTWNTLGEFLDTLERRGTASNFCSYVGSGAVRAIVVGYENRPATPVEIEEEKRIVREAMAEGAMGLSSALSYVPNIYMSTEELTALAKEAAAAGGIYATHIRTVNGRDPEAVREAIVIGEGASLPVHLFHLNSVASTSADKFLSIIREARQRGVKVTADAYPYTWGITGLSDYLPVWAQADGIDSMLARLRDPEQRRRIAKGFRTEEPFYLTSWDRVRLGVSDPAINGKLVSEVAEMRHKDADDVYMDIVLEQRGKGLVIDRNNEEATLKEVMLEPYVSVGTDGSAVDLQNMDKLRDNDLVSPLLHPRHLGTFPRWLAKYVREEHLMTLEEAIRRMTSLAAETLGLNDRGVLAPYKFADVVVFDPNAITDKATYEDPNHYSEGVRYLLVNGKFVVQDGKVTSALPGRALRRSGYQTKGIRTNPN
jgi:N-acyl-D-aspartate/D-glutamate deacylase